MKSHTIYSIPLKFRSKPALFPGFYKLKHRKSHYLRIFIKDGKQSYQIDHRPAGGDGVGTNSILDIDLNI